MLGKISLNKTKLGISSNNDSALMCRSLDYERYICIGFSKLDIRSSLLALVCFHSEISSICGKVNEPMIARIRFQWWRESITTNKNKDNGNKHEISFNLNRTIKKYNLSTDKILKIIDTREIELEKKPPPNISALFLHAKSTGGVLNEMMANILVPGCSQTASRACAYGTVWTVINILKRLSINNNSILWLPSECIERHNINIGQLKEEIYSSEVSKIVKEILYYAKDLLANEGPVPKSNLIKGRSALLIKSEVDYYFKAFKKVEYNPWRVRKSSSQISILFRLVYSIMTKNY